jgi:hypothetical protein
LEKCLYLDPALFHWLYSRPAAQEKNNVESARDRQGTATKTPPEQHPFPKFKDIIQTYDMKHNTLMTYSIDCTDSLKCFVHKVGHIARQLSLGSSFHCRLSLLHKIVHRHDSFVKSVTNADERPVKTDSLGLLIAMLLSDADRWAALILCLWTCKQMISEFQTAFL